MIPITKFITMVFVALSAGFGPANGLENLEPYITFAGQFIWDHLDENQKARFQQAAQHLIQMHGAHTCVNRYAFMEVVDEFMPAADRIELEAIIQQEMVLLDL